MPADPPDDALLSAAEVAAWLDVDETWLAPAIADDTLPVMGYTSDGAGRRRRRGPRVAAPPGPARRRDLTRRIAPAVRR